MPIDCAQRSTRWVTTSRRAGSLTKCQAAYRIYDCENDEFEHLFVSVESIKDRAEYAKCVAVHPSVYRLHLGTMHLRSALLSLAALAAAKEIPKDEVKAAKLYDSGIRHANNVALKKVINCHDRCSRLC